MSIPFDVRFSRGPVCQVEALLLIVGMARLIQVAWNPVTLFFFFNFDKISRAEFETKQLTDASDQSQVGLSCQVRVVATS